MYKALAYKEWLKVKWVVIACFILEIILLAYIFTSLRAIFEYNGAVTIWSTIIYRQYMYFDIIKYVPFLMGIVIAVAQYLPEISDMKLKLTLHLPMDENKVLLFLNFYGVSILFSIFLPFIFILIIGSIIVFPAELVYATFLTISPWFLAGFLSYFFTTSILIEPTWKRRMAIAVIGFFMINQFLIESIYGAYQRIIVQLLIFTFLFNYVHMISGLRFKRGAK